MKYPIETICNMISTISEKFDMRTDIQIVDAKDNENPSLMVNYSPKTDTRSIEIIKDMDGNVINPSPLSILNLDTRLFSFIRNIGYDDNDGTRILIIVLHEFGHFDYIQQMYKFNFGRHARFLKAFTHRFPANKLTPEDYWSAREEGIDIPYMIRGDEMYADAFAMKNFVPMYNTLREMNIIG